MKLNNLNLNLNFKFKKINKDFDPNKHWYQLLFLVLFILVLIIIYSVYNFLYIRNEISKLELEAQNNILNSTSSDYLEKTKKNNQLIRDINNLGRNLERFEQREVEYQRILKSSPNTNVVITSTSSLLVATSTKE